MNFTSGLYTNLEFTVITTAMPGLSVAEVPAPAKNSSLFVPSEKITWENLTVRALANENLENYLEVFNWMLANYNSDAPVDSDIILTLLTSHKNINKQFRFLRAFPVSLGGFELTTSAEGVEYVGFDVSFRYDRFELI
jgi:hypothetical protein